MCPDQIVPGNRLTAVLNPVELPPLNVIMVQVSPGHRRTVVDRDPIVRNGLHFALAAVVKTLRDDSSSADLVSAPPARSVGMREGGASLL